MIRDKKTSQGGKGRPNSRQRLKQLQKQQQYLSEAFKIDNFYNNQKLDIKTLKNRINQIKKRGDEHDLQIRDNPEDDKARNKVRNQKILVPLSNKIQKLCTDKRETKKINSGRMQNRQSATSQRNKKNFSAFQKHFYLDSSSSFYNNKQSQDVKLSSSRNRNNHQIQLNSIDRYQSIEEDYDKKLSRVEQQKMHGQFRSTIIPKIQNIGRRQSIHGRSVQKSNSLRKTMNSSRLEPISSYKKKISLLQVQTEQQLSQFESNIISLWQIYQKLCDIVKILSQSGQEIINDSTISQQFIKILCEYKEYVCSTRLQFLINVIDSCLDFSNAKTIIISRLLENLSIVYIFLQIVQQTMNQSSKFCSSHLVNFVGLGSNNILLLIRLITLVTVIDESLAICQKVSNIFQAIFSFEINSFREQLSSIKQITIRIDHNNELISIIQAKINNKMMAKEYHKGCFGKFVKGVVIDRLKQQIQIAGQKVIQNQKIVYQTKPFYQYSYFIFQYLAFHLHHEQCLGLFPKQIQTAPEPYIPLKKQFTIVIDPIKVFVYENKNKFFVRAYSDKFLIQLSSKCNIIFWSSKMPNQIDSLYDLVDVFLSAQKNSAKNALNLSSNLSEQKKQKIKRLYKHHCFFDYNMKGQISLIKDISRVGCQQGKYIILDSNYQSYYPYQESNILILPWKGQPKDSKLMTVLDFLLPFFREGTDLRKGMKLLKPRLQQLLKIRKQKYSHKN